MISRLPRKHLTPKEDDQEYLLTSLNGESAPLSCLKTYCEEYNVGIDAGPDITMDRLSLGMRVKEFPSISVGMIGIVAAPATRTIVTFTGYIILLSGELHGTLSPKVEIFPTTWGMGVVKVQVGLWS